MFCDAHNHLQDARLAGPLDGIIKTCAAERISRMVVNGTREDDWPRVIELAKKFPMVGPSFGLHPWFTNQPSKQWRDRLLRHLDAMPSAVGEIGIDRWMDGHDIERQEEIFRWQLAVAAERDLPVSIHCLKCWGKLDEILRDAELPQRGFLLHSYGGPAEMIDGFVKLGGYFSISGYFAHERKQRQRDAFKRVPLDRLLVETDAPDMLPPEELIAHGHAKSVNHPANLSRIYAFAANLRSVEPEEFARQIAENFERLFGGLWTA